LKSDSERNSFLISVFQKLFDGSKNNFFRRNILKHVLKYSAAVLAPTVLSIYFKVKNIFVFFFIYLFYFYYFQFMSSQSGIDAVQCFSYLLDSDFAESEPNATFSFASQLFGFVLKSTVSDASLAEKILFCVSRFSRLANVPQQLLQMCLVLLMRFAPFVGENKSQIIFEALFGCCVADTMLCLSHPNFFSFLMSFSKHFDLIDSVILLKKNRKDDNLFCEIASKILSNLFESENVSTTQIEKTAQLISMFGSSAAELILAPILKFIPAQQLRGATTIQILHIARLNFIKK
jgi:hypothetical protein